MSHATKNGPDPNPISSGGRIALLRFQRGMTQAQLADKIGTTYRTIGLVESGVQSGSAWVRARIAEALGVSEAELLDVPVEPVRGPCAGDVIERSGLRSLPRGSVVTDRFAVRWSHLGDDRWTKDGLSSARSWSWVTLSRARGPLTIRTLPEVAA